MVIPANINHNGLKFNGAFAFYIDPQTILLRGIIDHLITDNDNFYQRNVERSLYIEELLYTKSQCLIRIHRIYELKAVKNINIPCLNNNQPILILPPPPPPPPPVPEPPILPVNGGN